MSCNRCNCSPCSCSALPGVPTPYYGCAPSCPEDHTYAQPVYLVYFGLTISPSWNIPVSGGSIVLPLKANAVPIGAMIWADTFGYFRISSFDYDKQEVTITNEGRAGNATPGTQVPRCTTFAVTPTPCCSDDQSGVFVKYDFTAPAIDDCLDITLTSIQGLIAGNKVQIGTTGVYNLTDIKADNVVRICNDGEGITPGSPVIAQNAAGEYQYPVTSISVNSCAQDAVPAGAMLVCVDGVGATLGGGNTNDLLTRNAEGQGFWTDTIPNEVNQLVTDVAEMETDIVDLETGLTNLGNYVAGLKGFQATDSTTPAGPAVTLKASNPTLTSEVATVVITNDSVRTQAFFYTIVARIFGNPNVANAQQVTIDYDLQINVDGAGYISASVMDKTYWQRTDSNFRQDVQVTWTGISVKAPAAGFTLDAKVVVTWEGFSASEFIVDSAEVAITAIGVPLA